MFLKKIGIINYKSCRNIIIDFKDNLPNTFIGKTDSGKTTILKAIGLILDEKNLPNLIAEGQDCSDVSTTPSTTEDVLSFFERLDLPAFDKYTRDSLIVVGIFSMQSNDFGEDFNESGSDHLKWSIESYSTSDIAILRHFNNEFRIGRYFVCSMDDVADTKELWKQNQTVLNGLIKELKISDQDIKNDNKKGRFKNLEKLRAIYNKLKISPKWAEYQEFSKKDRIFFPLYRYIDWKDIGLKSVEDIARDALVGVIEKYQKELETHAKELGEKATKDVNSELDSRIKSVITGISSITSISARVFFESTGIISEISVQKSHSDGNIRLDSQGDGVKKQIGFAFMKLAATQGVEKEKVGKSFLWAFDEPEVHLYPPEKRDFYEIIKQLSSGTFQTFISTHSTVFVDKSQMDTIKQAYLFDKYTNIAGSPSVVDIFNTLGMKNSDFLFYDFFVACEGDTEEILVPHFYSLYFNKTTEADSLQIINLGGSTQWKNNKKLFEQTMKNFKEPKDIVYYVLDADTREKAENVFLIGKNDIEDSIDDKFWTRLVKDQCGILLNDTDIQEIRNSIGDGASHKFHKLLADKVELKGGMSHLPDKKDCAIYMKQFIIDKNDIPVDIVNFFNKTRLDQR